MELGLKGFGNEGLQGARARRFTPCSISQHIGLELLAKSNACRHEMILDKVAIVDPPISQCFSKLQEQTPKHVT